MTEEDLRKALTRNSQDHRTWRCPDENLIAAYVDRGISGRAREQVEKHLAACNYCLGQAAELTRLLDSDPSSDIPPFLVARARELAPFKALRRKPVWRWGAIGATACIAILATLLVRQPGMPIAPPVESFRKAPERVDYPAMLLPRDGETLEAGSIAFRWTPVEGAMHYELRLLSADGDLIWQSRTDETDTRITKDVTLSPGQRYYVSVTASMPDGKSLKSSLIEFGVTRRR